MSWISVATGALLLCAGTYILGSHVLPAYEEYRALRLVSCSLYICVNLSYSIVSASRQSRVMENSI